MDKKIVMLAGGGESTAFMYHGLAAYFTIHTVIIEEGTDLKTFLKRRIKKLGWWQVIGQVLFTKLCVPLIRSGSQARIQQIKDDYQLNDSPVDPAKVFRVPSVNSEACLRKLKEINPDVIVVNGTRIITKKILNAVAAPFINTHVGITPAYRGVHGAYWALAQDDRAHCGVTVHLVDAGIDTGNILYQAVIHPIKKDNFLTYTHMQLGEGIRLMKKAVGDALAGELKPLPSGGSEGKIWYHPTLWYYLYKRITKGVR